MMKLSIYKALPSSYSFIGRPLERRPALAKSPQPSWAAAGCFLNQTLSLTCVLSILLIDQGRKFNI